VKEAYNLGIVDYMLKPVIIDELRLVLEKANSMLKKKAHNKVIQRSQASILIKTILENKLNKLITADETSKPDTMELFSELKVYFPHQFFAVAIVSEVRSCSSEFEKTKQNERLVTALVEIYRTTDVILHGIVNSKDQLVLVFNFSDKTSLNYIKQVIRTHKSFRDNDAQFIVSLSGAGHGLKDVTNCYNHALKAYSYRIIYNIDGFVEYADLSNIDKQMSTESKEKLQTFQDRIQMYFTAGKIFDISNMIDDIFSKEKLKAKSIECIEYLFHSIVHIMDSARLLHGMRIEPVEYVDFHLFNDLSDLRIYLKAMSHRILAQMREHDHSRSLSEMAKNYIQLNFSKDIDMTMVANQASVSYSYFS